MKRHLSFLAALLLVGGGALAVDWTVQRTPWAFLGTTYFGSAATASSTHAVVKALAGSRDYNFPATTNTCLDSPSITVTGVTLGDPCMVGVDQAPGEYDISCYVSAADTVKVHFCPSPSDGGPNDPIDAGYRVRVITNR